MQSEAARTWNDILAREADVRHREIIEFARTHSRAETAREFGITEQRLSAILLRAERRGLLAPAG